MQYLHNKLDNGLFIVGPDDVIDFDSIYAFDLDSTLIKPKSGKKHPINESDWMWFSPEIPTIMKELSKNHGLVIFTNQAGIDSKKLTIDEISRKLNNIYKELGFGILTFISTGYSKWRKPSPNMWNYFIENFAPGVVLAKSIFIGDAAGRETDFSADDRKFTINCKLRFATPEEFWLKHPCENYMDSYFAAFNKFKEIQCSADEIDAYFKDDFSGMVLMCGPPGCGKSTIARKYFPNHVYVNQDTIANGKPGTKAKCLSYAKSSILNGKNVIIDKTFPDLQTRKEFIDIAIANNVQIVCIWINIPIQVAKYMNNLRCVLGGNKVPDITYAVFQKKFQAPTQNERINKIICIEKINIDEEIMPSEVKELVF
ncbi:Bifunctional polynucleotide phosphatase/kinase [Pacmanvirus A23]|uniref:Bifunctional polynucleotide phosphatase/kinase n=1 Tax=Pacmanvirus A23 TaxID=1932881 RepID=UPI000A09569C|nr:Bifunctional polynucleotide phosphatase/kinase [Pacmanvirus A23]SIP85947.1 Bifunctional polynucleotide phosphatase/kinase [Pacmanvirus A23]